MKKQKLKTFNISFRPDPDSDELEVVTYEAKSMDSAHGMFINDYPEQAGQYRETHSPLSNYKVDEENLEMEKEDSSPEEPVIPVEEDKGFLSIFTKVTTWVKMVTMLLISLIGLGIVTEVIFGNSGGFGIGQNISNLLIKFDGLAGLIVLFLVYYLFIRCGKEDA